MQMSGLARESQDATCCKNCTMATREGHSAFLPKGRRESMSIGVCDSSGARAHVWSARRDWRLEIGDGGRGGGGGGDGDGQTRLGELVCRLHADWLDAPKLGISWPIRGRCTPPSTTFVARRPQMPPLTALPSSPSRAVGRGVAAAVEGAGRAMPGDAWICLPLPAFAWIDAIRDGSCLSTVCERTFCSSYT